MDAQYGISGDTGDRLAGMAMDLGVDEGRGHTRKDETQGAGRTVLKWDRYAQTHTRKQNKNPRKQNT